jgi:ArsR family transcriptional regulator, arsenate/arsenite/antimonite-responsive transcriptional repressor
MFSMVIDCCTPFLTERIGADEAARLAERFRALSDPTRVRLLSLIAERGEVCACELVGVLPVSQPTLSHHLKVLHDAGILEREREGRWVHYRVRDDAVTAMHRALAVPVATA